jgi:poly(3-hydroxybutyrate) depolymerase
MENCVFLRAGTPNDDNRDYLPEEIKGSDMVVNENGNNSHPYPERLVECTGILADGLEDRWYEYVPASYDGSKPVPLVVGNHGGLMTGWGHAIYTSWTLLADREGFICVFPDAHQARIWQVEGMFNDHTPTFLGDVELAKVPKDYRENHDLNFMKALIAAMQKKYNIDSGRIFMQGMSAGNLMTAQFCRYYGNILAGAAGSGGPTQLDMLFTDDGTIKNVAGHLPVWQARPEKNGTPPGRPYGEPTLNRFNRFYWMELNGCEKIPQISIVGENNYAFYKGEKADLVYHDIKNRDHGQTLDEAFLYWDYFFSGLRRNEDGSITQTVMFEPDPTTGKVALPEGTVLEPMVLYALFEDAAATASAETTEGA